MSEEFVSGCINHKDVRHLRLYYDYMDLYQDNEHKAMIVRILETWTNHKRAQWYKENYDRLEQGKPIQLPDFWITMSYQQFRDAMRSTANAETIRKSLAGLEKTGHISRRINPDNPYGAPQYLLNCQVIQAALNKLATPPYIPELPDIEEDTPPGNSIPPHSFTPTQGVVLPPPRGLNYPVPPGSFTPTQGTKLRTSNNTSKDYNLDNTNDSSQEREGADAPPSREEHQQLEEKVDETLEEVEDALEDTQKRQAVKPSQHTSSTLSTGGAATAGHPPVPHREPRAPDRVQASATVPAATPLPAEPISPPARRARGTVPKRPKDAKVVTMDGPPQEPPIDATWGTRTCMQLFNYWRGVTLIGKWKNSQASECAKGLSERYSREYVVAARSVMETDKYYVERGGADICDVANNIHKYKKKIEAKLSEEHGEQEGYVGNGPDGFDRYVGNGPEERAKVLREALELEARGALPW